MPGEILKDPILEKLRSVAERLNAVAVCDVNEAKPYQYRKINGSENIYMVYPKLKVANGDKIIDVPSSGTATGILARTPFWESPSNKVCNGVLGTSNVISFALDDPDSKGQLLNKQQISTFVRQDGIRLWGSRGTGDQTDLKTNFIHKVRIRNAIREAISASQRWAVAKNITTNYIEAVTSSVNSYLASLIGTAILSGKCYLDKDDNTEEQISDGTLVFTYEYTPTAVSEKITFKEKIQDNYLKNLV